MSQEHKDIQFDQRKKHILAELASVTRDRSPKGFPDHRVLPLLDYINSLPDYVTTSSCSGRVVVYRDRSKGEEELEKKGGSWLLVSHDPVDIPTDEKDLMTTCFGDHICEAIDSGVNDNNANREAQQGIEPEQVFVSVRFEPFILHVQARTLDHARLFLKAALAAGYKHSGMVTTAKRHIIHVVGNLKVDAPIGYWLPKDFVNLKQNDTKETETKHEGVVRLLVGSNYLRTILSLCNDKFKINDDLMNRFHSLLSTTPWQQKSEEEGGQGVAKESFAQRKVRKIAAGLKLQALQKAQASNSTAALSGEEEAEEGVVDLFAL